jgi:hypothetical protein
MKTRMKVDEDLSDDEYLRIKSGVGRDMYDEDDDENDDEDDEDDCHEFDDMMRLAKKYCRVMLCMMAMGENDHDYDIQIG